MFNSESILTDILCLHFSLHYGFNLTEQQIIPSQLTNDDLVQQYSANTVSSTPSVGGGGGAGSAGNNNSNQVQYTDIHVQSSTNASHLRPAIDIPLNSSSLSAEQSQYFNSLSSQPVSAVQYSSPYACKFIAIIQTKTTSFEMS